MSGDDARSSPPPLALQSSLGAQNSTSHIAEPKSSLDTSSPQRTIDGEVGAEVEEEQATTLPEIPRLKPGHLNVLILGLCVSLLLSTLETTIVSTALVTITNELNGFSQRDWIVTSYLLTYTGFLTIFAKFSDIFGQKFLILIAISIFMLFSILCGVSDSITSLIILRAFQGLGGSGIYSMVMVITPKVVPRPELGKYMAVVSSVFALASILGPVLGGIITSSGRNWRWIFYLNGPVGAVATALLVAFLPSSAADKATFRLIGRRVTNSAWRRVDLLGAFLLLAASVLLVFVLEETGAERYPWKSAAIIVSLICAILCWITLPVWEHYVDTQLSTQEPIFPVRLLKDRLYSGMMLVSFFTGFPFMVVVVNLPQRFQAVNDKSPLLAGVYLLPLLLCSPFASGASGYFCSKLKTPPLYLILVGSVFQLVGVCLMTTLPSRPFVLERQQFGYEVIMGFGFGSVLSTLLLLTPALVKDSEIPVTMGALTQVRVLGGTLGLAICSTILNKNLRSRLEGQISPAIVVSIQDSASNIQSLSQAQQDVVRTAFAESYTLQMRVAAGFSGLVLLMALLLLEKKPRKLS